MSEHDYNSYNSPDSYPIVTASTADKFLEVNKSREVEIVVEERAQAYQETYHTVAQTFGKAAAQAWAEQSPLAAYKDVHVFGPTGEVSKDLTRSPQVPTYRPQSFSTRGDMPSVLPSVYSVRRDVASQTSSVDNNPYPEYSQGPEVTPNRDRGERILKSLGTDTQRQSSRRTRGNESTSHPESKRPPTRSERIRRLVGRTARGLFSRRGSTSNSR